MTYYTSMEEHPIDILNLPSLEERVKANMERGAFGSVSYTHLTLPTTSRV